jgi:hypothetical protein
VLCFIFFTQQFYAQEKKEKFFQTSFYLGPGLAKYKSNNNHSDNLKSKPTFNTGFKCLFTINKSTYFFSGIQLLTHGNSFKSYFFADSSIRIYDKQYAYEYNSRFNDIVFQNGLRYKFTENPQTKKYIYGELGCGIKKRMSGLLDVSSVSFGNSVYYDTPEGRFDNRILPKEYAFSLLFATGFDKHFREKKTAYFFELNFQYGLNRFYYLSSPSFPEDLYLQESFLFINTGIRF